MHARSNGLRVDLAAGYYLGTRYSTPQRRAVGGLQRAVGAYVRHSVTAPNALKCYGAIGTDDYLRHTGRQGTIQTRDCFPHCVALLLR